MKKYFLYILMFFLFLKCQNKQTQIEQEQVIDDFIYIKYPGKIKIKISDTLVARLLDSTALIDFWSGKGHDYKLREKDAWKYQNRGYFLISSGYIKEITTHTYLNDFTILQISKLSKLKSFKMIHGVWYTEKLSLCFKNVEEALILNIKFPTKKIIIDKNFSKLQELRISSCDFDEIIFEKGIHLRRLSIRIKDLSKPKIKIINPPKVDVFRSNDKELENMFSKLN